MQSFKGGAEVSDKGANASSRSRPDWPQPEPGAQYVAFLGGSATLGKSVAQSFPTLVATATGIPVLNLGIQNGGPDAYLSDPEVLHLVSRAEVAVVQLTGAETLTNPFYSVHARRNDRFLAATPELQALFPEVDFTEIHFARHLLQVLARTDANRFAQVVRALKATWVARMQSLLVHLPLRRHLLWLSEVLPLESAETFGADPLYIDRSMVERLRPRVGEVFVAVPGDQVQDGDQLDTPFSWAGGLPGPDAHLEAARVLAPVIAAQVRRPPLLLRHALVGP